MKHLFFLAVISILSLNIQGCSEGEDKQNKGQPAKEPPPIPVETVTVNEQQVPIWIEYTGKTEATQRIEVRARVSGRLEEIFFEEGQYVEKGKKLFRIEQTSYQASLEQAQAQLELDQASLQLAIADVDRYKPLVAKDLAPRATLDEYKARANELRATIKSDQAGIKEARLNLSYTVIHAPASGRISRKNIDVGNIVGYTEKTLLTTIIFDDPMYAYFNPTEEQFQVMRQHKSKDRMEAKVRVPGTAKHLVQREEYKGFVDFGDNRVDSSTGTISMRASVPNSKHDLLEGTFVYVDVLVSNKPKFLMIAPNAVLEDQKGSFVYIANGNNKAERVDIVRGFEARLYLQITKGLTSGDRLIITGLPKVKPGTNLTVKDVTAEKSVMAILKKEDMLPEE